MTSKVIWSKLSQWRFWLNELEIFGGKTLFILPLNSLPFTDSFTPKLPGTHWEPYLKIPIGLSPKTRSLVSFPFLLHWNAPDPENRSITVTGTMVVTMMITMATRFPKEITLRAEMTQETESGTTGLPLLHWAQNGHLAACAQSTCTPKDKTKEWQAHLNE